MSIGLTTPTQAFVATQVDQAYCNQRQRYQQRKLRMAIRYRRRLVFLRAAFQQELDRAMSARLQKGLGLKIRLSEQSKHQAHFMAQFEFEGQQWVLTCQRYLWRCDWFFANADQNRVVRCTHRTLERRLCYALGHRRARSLNLKAA
ncbi:hypothetical protein [Acaryochloris sp. CCMEE 5410]|uniref:hypothetical protein n=1 Tax=Acaryochloris sp. CCMEE 5410 TaxID=310037 RepID=UPI00024849A0|nr:hypothetical protein [Acaryochloris sp. CCMEE 5410]KAI9134175.1 hypothetical protein ON05_013390 [Acaryochloris sp. CCMEE 5410]